MKTLLLFFGCLPTILLAQEFNFSDVRASIATHEEQQLISGAISITQNDSTLFAETFGYADWEHEIPISDETRFGIGSITKSLTDIIVMQLVSEGVLSLDATVDSYIPGFPPSPRGRVPTIEQLVNHRSGIPHRVTDAIDETQALNAQAIVERVKVQGLLFEPGSRRLYSSAGYTVLARVTEIASNLNFADSLQSRIFAPANMEHAVNEPGAGLLTNKARPYRLGTTDSLVVKNSPYKDLRFLDGAASVYASTDDLKNLIRAISGNLFGEEVRESILRENSQGRVSIAGRTNGYEAWIDHYPSENISMIFLSNLQSASHWQLREQLFNVLEGRETADVPFPPEPAESFESHDAILGIYGAAVISLQDGKLFRGENEFYPTSDSRYYIPGSGSSMRFEKDSSGNSIALIHINPDGSTRTIERSN